MTHVPYRGSGPALTDMISGNVQVMFDPITSSISHIQAGTLRALGVGAAERTTLLPDLPTVAESGFPDFRASAWFAIVTPAGLPDGISKRLKSATDGALRDAAFRTRLEQLGHVVMRPQEESETKAFVDAERARWSTLIKTLNISLD